MQFRYLVSLLLHSIRLSLQLRLPKKRYYVYIVEKGKERGFKMKLHVIISKILKNKLKYKEIFILKKITLIIIIFFFSLF